MEETSPPLFHLFLQNPKVHSRFTSVRDNDWVVGLTEIVERLAEFVGPSKNDVPVEFVIPQIIGEVNTTEERLTLVTGILLIFQVRHIPHKFCYPPAFPGRGRAP